MANPWLDRSCCQTHSDITYLANHPRTQRFPHFREQHGSIPPYPFGPNDFNSTVLPNINDSYRSSTMGLTQGRYECHQRTEHPPGTTPSNRSVCYTSTTTKFFNLYQSVPPQTELHDTLPPFLANTGDQTLSLIKQFEGYAHENLPDVVGFRGTAHGRRFSTDATPFDDLAPQETENLEDVAPGTLHSNGENVQYAADPLRTLKAEHIPVFDPSYIPIDNDDFSKTDTIHQWPSSLAVTSSVSAMHCSAPQVTSYDSVGHLGTLTSSQCHYKNSKDNDPNLPTVPSVPRPLRRLLKQEPCPSDTKEFNPPTVPSVSRPRWRRLRQKPCLSDADSSETSTSHLVGLMKPDPSEINSSDFSNTCLLVPKEPPLDDVDSSKPATPCHPIKDEPSLEETEPSNTSVINDVDLQVLIDKYTNQNDDSSDECQVCGFDAPEVPNISPPHTPKYLEPCTAQHSSQPFGDAGFEEKLQPPEMDCQQTISDISPPASEPHKKDMNPKIEKEKEQITKTNPNRVRKSYSSIRRHNPRYLYWCADPTCRASQSRAFRGFRTTEDTRRHLAMHEPPKMLCKLPHKEGVAKYEGRRTDNLRE